MKIAFVPQNCIPFHARTLDERPLGGIETAAIRLSAALDALGAEVKVFTPIENPPLSSPLYLPYRALEDLGPCDFLIAIRDWQGVLIPAKAKYRLFWTGDSYDQPQTVGIGDKRVRDAIDILCPVSDWHARTLCEYSGFPKSKTYVLRNGIHREYFVPSELRKPKRLVYSSTPYRGLKLLPRIYAELLKTHPDLELHVFSGFGVYAGSKIPPQAMKDYENMRAELDALPGCIVHGSVPQQELAKEFLRSGIMLYPNTFEETSCISVMEAQAAGLVVVTCDRGALAETVGDAGVLVPANENEEAFIQSFIEATAQLLSDAPRQSRLSERALERSRSTSWDAIATNFLAFLETRLSSAEIPK